MNQCFHYFFIGFIIVVHLVTIKKFNICLLTGWSSTLFTGTIYRITFKSKRHNLQQQRRPYTVVIKSYITFVTDSRLMMAQSRAESTRDTYNYGQYLNQFPPNTIKVIREFERIQKRICWHKMSIMFNEICIYIYIYMCVCVCVYVYTYIYIYMLPHPVGRGGALVV